MKILYVLLWPHEATITALGKATVCHPVACSCTLGVLATLILPPAQAHDLPRIVTTQCLVYYDALSILGRTVTPVSCLAGLVLFQALCCVGCSPARSHAASAVSGSSSVTGLRW